MGTRVTKAPVFLAECCLRTSSLRPMLRWPYVVLTPICGRLRQLLARGQWHYLRTSHSGSRLHGSDT